MTISRSLICVTMLAVLATATAASGGIVVWLEPASETVAVSDFVDVDIMANFDVPVFAWGLDLTVGEPSYAGWTLAAIGPLWDPPDEWMDNDHLSALQFPNGVIGEDVLLATLSFEGLSEGVTSLTLSAGSDEDEGILLESELATDVEFLLATLTVTPEPATLALLLASAGAVLLRRRR